MKFKLKSLYKPSGDQPQAIKQLLNNFYKGEKEQIILGATGTGKTFTIANII
ncbi:MAG: DEAD/DEAH box helicase family protein, partial [Candidatus Phytoplasma australasiaticum]|nr:DEAD/DEAH box helicase family protein [Candidatus Phytoplasma australasiaticum]